MALFHKVIKTEIKKGNHNNNNKEKGKMESEYVYKCKIKESWGIYIHEYI
jgi:hypothetical protein